MNYFLNMKEKEGIDRLNDISGLHHRSTPYDLNNSNDLKEMLKIKVCALLDYIEYDNLLVDLLDRFDESIEYYDTRTWLSFAMDIEKPDTLLLKCYDNIGKASDDFYKLVTRTSGELEYVLNLVVKSSAEIQKAVLGFDLSNIADVKDKIGDVLDDINDVENAKNMEEAYENFLSFLRGIFLYNDS